METKWKAIFIVFFLAVIGIGAVNYFFFGAVLLSPNEIGLSPDGENNIMRRPLTLLTWPMLLSTLILVFIVLVVTYKLKKVQYAYTEEAQEMKSKSK